MIMELPKNNGVKNLKNGAYIEDGILKIRNMTSFKSIVYDLTFQLKGGKHQCNYCKKSIYHNKVTMDHIYPQYMGGPTITNNLIPVCENCNRTKSNMTYREYNKYLKLKEKNSNEKEYLKKLNVKKEEMQRKHKYQIPKGWIYEEEISKILLEVRLEDSTRTSKYRKVAEFYKEYGYFQKPIVIDKNGFLLDGFYTVFYAKLHAISTLPVIKLENVELIF